jgi:hypothetical protein
VISHIHKAVFVHIPRTGGQSIEHVFLRHLGLDQRMRSALLLREKTDSESGPPRLSHLTAEQYVECGYLTQQQFRDYYTFGFVRNPWQRVISFYNYLGYATKCGFIEFVTDILVNKLIRELPWFILPQCEYLFDSENRQLVNFVGRFENIQQNFEIVCTTLGLPKIPLPLINQSPEDNNFESQLLSPDEKSAEYQKHYDANSQKIVTQIYARDIELLGYKF